MPKQVPFVDYLVLGDDPHLVANECTSCGALFYDRRNACAHCGKREFGARRLSNDGVVRSFTIVHRATPDVKVPYVSAVIDLEGGGMAKANIIDVDPTPEEIKLGMKVTLATFPIGTDPEGIEAVSFAYRPL